MEETDKKNIQVYSKEPINDDLVINENPYKSEDEMNRLQNLSFIFYRDEDNTDGAIWRESSEITEAVYNWFIYSFKEKRIVKRILINRPCRIMWMDKQRVNRVML